MNIAVLIPALVFLMSVSAFSQDAFKVLAVRGAISSGSGSKVAVGTKLSVKDKIVIGKNAYTSLVHTNGRTVELKKEGSFKIADLDKAAKQKSTNVSGKFASYVVNELTEVKEPIAFSDSRKSKMGTTGSVERLDGDEVRIYDSIAAVIGGAGELQALAALSSNTLAQGAAVLAIMPRHTRLLDDSLALIWHRTPAVKQYVVEVYDRNDKMIFTTTTSDTMVKTTTQSLHINPNELCFWRVRDASNNDVSSDYFALYRLQGDERVSTEELLMNVKGELEDQDAAVSQLILAAAFEDQGLMYNAHRAYQAAIASAPAIRNYQLMYAEFLRRQNLSVDAYAVLK